MHHSEPGNSFPFRSSKTVRRKWRLIPGGEPIRQIFAYSYEEMCPVADIEKIPRHRLKSDAKDRSGVISQGLLSSGTGIFATRLEIQLPPFPDALPALNPSASVTNCDSHRGRQMKKLLLATTALIACGSTAFAADMRIPRPAAPPADRKSVV